MLYLITFLGAGVGGALRHGVNVWAVRAFGYGFPLGTLIVNVLGSFIMGLLLGFFAFRAGFVPQHARLFLTTDVLGGFTTFSAFSVDAALLFERHSYSMAMAYIVGSVFASLVALFMGLAIFNGFKPLT
jgi:CrcB protein